MNNLKLYLIIVIAVLFLALAVLFKQYTKQVETLQEVTQAVALANAETTYYRTSSGELVSQVKTLSASVETMRLVFGENLKDLENKFGPLKNLSNYVSAGIKSAGTIYTNIRDTTINDTIKAKKFEFSDKYLSLNCVLVNDSVQCPYTYQDSIEVAVTMDRNWKWFQFKKMYTLKNQGFDKYTPVTKVVFANPNTKAIGVKSYIVK